MEKKKIQKLKEGQIVYVSIYKTEKIDFHTDLIVGLKLVKRKVLKITPKFFEIKLDGFINKINKEKLGKYIFLSKKECVKFIIKETEERLEQLREKFENNSEYLQYLALPKDLKKWNKKLVILICV